MKAKEAAEELLNLAGVQINGSRPFDITIHNPAFYRRILGGGTLALGESYMDGWWDAKQPDQLIQRLLSADLRNKVRINSSLVKQIVVSTAINRQTTKKAKQNASFHYNIGNDLYERMLDKNMIYSCAYWKDAKTLDQAQIDKLELICKKLHLKKGMTLLDIGCGWGGFAEYAARIYGVKVTGISPAIEQVKLAKERTKGLSVTILQKDYRQIDGHYDRIVSIGMLEHVGYKNFKEFFSTCHGLLKDGGIMLHHTIGSNRSLRATEPWIDKYIFRGSMIPSIAQISGAVENKLIIEDVHNFGPYYDKTLMAWQANFAKHYKEISDKYDERFYRMWNYYLYSCAGAFRARHLQLWQFIMRKIEPSQPYVSVR